MYGVSCSSRTMHAAAPGYTCRPRVDVIPSLCNLDAISPVSTLQPAATIVFVYVLYNTIQFELLRPRLRGVILLIPTVNNQSHGNCRHPSTVCNCNHVAVLAILMCSCRLARLAVLCQALLMRAAPVVPFGPWE